ncbi:hypothetical protein [Virgibacillus doumboii]|uniref:hypothetical protein n=1 Tax=Virgibacillus doumboii TaxID=2697503 RepID=UPI0013E0BDEC|nr:hypothetical protein [Virgibacillus doumboii]
MKKQRKKKEFPLPTQANANSDGEFRVHDGLDANHPFEVEDNYAGDSVDKHKELEDANETIAKKEISQINNNS